MALRNSNTPSGTFHRPLSGEKILNFNSCSCRKSLPGDKVDEMEISRGKRTRTQVKEIPKCGSKKIKLYANAPLWP